VTKVIAHRGAKPGRDNSIAAFERAIHLGCDMIETDVRKSKDGQLLLIHDDKISGHKVNESTSNELHDLFGYAPVRLDQLIDLAAGRIGLNLEIKEEGYESEIIEQLNKTSRDGLIISSLNYKVVKRVKEQDSSLATGLVSGANIRLSERFPKDKLKESNADFLIHHFVLAELGGSKEAERAGVPLIAWTVNSGPRLNKFINQEKIYGVITDYPDKALALRKKGQEKARQ